MRVGKREGGGKEEGSEGAREGEREGRTDREREGEYDHTIHCTTTQYTHTHIVHTHTPLTSAGLITTVFPAAKQGAIFHASIMRG